MFHLNRQTGSCRNLDRHNSASERAAGLVCFLFVGKVLVLKLDVRSSSQSLEDSEGFLLEILADLAGSRVSFGGLVVDVLEGEVFLLLDFEEVDFNGVVTINRTNIS